MPDGSATSGEDSDAAGGGGGDSFFDGEAFGLHLGLFAEGVDDVATDTQFLAKEGPFSHIEFQYAAGSALDELGLDGWAIDGGHDGGFQLNESRVAVDLSQGECALKGDFALQAPFDADRNLKAVFPASANGDRVGRKDDEEVMTGIIFGEVSVSGRVEQGCGLNQLSIGCNLESDAGAAKGGCNIFELWRWIDRRLAVVDGCVLLCKLS